MVAGLIRRRPGRQPSRQESGLFELSGGGRVEVMGFGASAIQFHSSVHDGRGNGLVGIGRPSLPVRKRRRGKRGDMAVCDHGCLSSRSARFIRDLNRHSVRSNDIGSPRLNLATGPWTQDPKRAKVCSVLGSCSAFRGWGRGRGTCWDWVFRQSERGWDWSRKGEALGPLLGCLLACLLACSLAVFISLCWTCASGLTFACPRQSSLSPSLSLHSSHHSAWPIEQNQPLCPFRSVSAQHRLHLHRRLSLVSPAKSPTSTSRTPPKKRALGPCCCPCEPAKFHIVDRSPPGKTVPCPSSSPQATFLCFETQPSKHRPSSAILGSPTDDDAPSAAAPPSLCSRCPP